MYLAHPACDTLFNKSIQVNAIDSAKPFVAILRSNSLCPVR